MRGNICEKSRLASARAFQFTPLHERQQGKSHRAGEQKAFQFTPLHERQLESNLSLLFYSSYFNSRLYMRGNAAARGQSLAQFLFQFTPLHERQRAWRFDCYNAKYISIHASTWEATSPRSASLCRSSDFNSRLYMRGNLIASGCLSDRFSISIHASTWEAT